jgi:hypothetical protein
LIHGWICSAGQSSSAETEATARHIALCSPTNITRLAEEIRRLQSENERIHGCLDDVNEALGEEDNLQYELSELRAKLGNQPAKWTEDSSLETWFPLTAKELTRTKDELAALRESHRELMVNNERLMAYRQWLRGGFREIANRKLTKTQEDDLYQQYAKDTLSGPTEDTIQDLIAYRREKAG